MPDYLGKFAFPRLLGRKSNNCMKTYLLYSTYSGPDFLTKMNGNYAIVTKFNVINIFKTVSLTTDNLFLPNPLNFLS